MESILLLINIDYMRTEYISNEYAITSNDDLVH